MGISGVFVHLGGFEAYEVGLAPKIILEATHIKTLDFISLQILEKYKF